MITQHNVITALMTDRLIGNWYVYSEKSPKYWSLISDIQVQLSNGDIITIPQGFKWDLSSSPKFLWGIVPPFGDFLFAALVHDYIYIEKTHSKEFADKEMLFWSNIINDNKLDNKVRYYAVKWFGKTVWRKGKEHPKYNPKKVK